MRVLIVGPYPEEIERPIGGVQAAAANLVSGLTNSPDIQLEVVANSRASALHTVDRPFGPVTFVPQRPGLRGWVQDIHGDLIREVRQRNADVVHIQGLASVAARVPGSILTIHGIAERDVWESHTGVRRLVRAGATYAMEGLPRLYAKQVIAVSNYAAEGLQRQKSQVWHIPNAIDQRYFSHDVQRGDSNLFLTSGTISPLKNTAGVISAFHVLHETNSSAQLLIAGEGAETAYGRYCIDLIRKLHLASNIELVGQRPSSQIFDLLRTVGTMIQFSNHENAPMAVAEALAAGPAVIGTRVGELPWMLKNLPGCHLVPPGDVRALAAAMLQSSFSEDPAWARQRHGSSLRYSPDVVARQTVAVYQQISTQTRRRG